MRKRDISDGTCLYCPSCNKTKTIRKNSSFAKSRVTLQEWLMLMYWWARQYSAKDAAEEAEVNKNTACVVFKRLREVCSTTLLATPIVLGGVCQIDESLFKHKPKVAIYDMILYIRYTIIYNVFDCSHCVV